MPRPTSKPELSRIAKSLKQGKRIARSWLAVDMRFHTVELRRTGGIRTSAGVYTVTHWAIDSDGDKDIEGRRTFGRTLEQLELATEVFTWVGKPGVPDGLALTPKEES